MDSIFHDQQHAAVRIALCAALAAVLCRAAGHWGPQLGLPESWLHQLKENKIMDIAVISALIFVLSLVLFPLSEPDTGCTSDEPGHAEDV